MLRKIMNAVKAETKMGRSVICFSTHGCMAQIHEFQWIGIIEGTTYPPLCQGSMFYVVKILKDHTGGELRDKNLSTQYENVGEFELQDLGGQLITYR